MTSANPHIASNVLALNHADASQALEKTLLANLVPMLQGSPGTGKSELIHALAKKYQLKVIDVRMAQCDPTDLLGFPSLDKEKGKASYLPMDMFPIQGDKIPEGYKGWLLFLDEFNSADRGVQKAGYKLVLDRMVGQYHLHKNVAIICAGNLMTDNAIVEEMGTALQSRLVHLELAVNSETWIDWAERNGVDHRITSFIKFKPDLLYKFDPHHEDVTFACPRTWRFADSLLQQVSIDDPLALPLLAGTISNGVAREFLVFSRVYQDLPNVDAIIRNPEGVRVPEEPGTLYALTGALAARATDSTIDPLMQYLNKLPMDFQVVCLQEICRRGEVDTTTPAIQRWIRDNGTQLF